MSGNQLALQRHYTTCVLNNLRQLEQRTAGSRWKMKISTQRFMQLKRLVVGCWRVIAQSYYTHGWRPQFVACPAEARGCTDHVIWKSICWHILWWKKWRPSTAVEEEAAAWETFSPRQAPAWMTWKSKQAIIRLVYPLLSAVAVLQATYRLQMMHYACPCRRLPVRSQ